MRRNKIVLDKFVKFCKENSKLRFWQALYAFSGAEMISVNNQDTFYWEGSGVMPQKIPLGIADCGSQKPQKDTVNGNIKDTINTVEDYHSIIEVLDELVKENLTCISEGGDEEVCKRNIVGLTKAREILISVKS